MSFLRSQAATPDDSVVEKKHGDLHDEWRQPPSDEHEIVGGVLRMLSGIEAMLPRPQEGGEDEFKSTRETIAFARTVIADISGKLKQAETAGFIAAGRMLWDFLGKKAEYLGNMEKLGKSFREVRITTESRERWKDVSVWLVALHNVTAHSKPDLRKDHSNFFLQPLSETAGDYPTVSDGDAYFKKASGVSKYTLVYHFGVAAKSLEEAISNFDSVQALTPRV